MMTYSRRLAINALAGAVMLGGCDDDDGVAPPVEPPVPAATTFEVTIKNVSKSYDFLGSGVFDTPDGADAPGPLHAGEDYHFDYLSFATMLVQSNDLFYAPDERGVGLFDASGAPISGDITDDVQLWNAGTEVNEAPGAGPYQAPRQTGPDAGADEEGGRVHDVDVMMSADGFHYPAITDVIRVTIRPLSN